MQELEKYINTYFGLSKQDLQTMAQLFDSEKLEKGQFYSETGKYCQKMSFIKSGYLRIFIHAETKEVTQWISGPASFVTDLSSMIFHTPGRWQIQALSDCDLYTLHADNYRRIADLIPRWHELEKIFLAKCFSMLEDRIMSFLSMDAESRYFLFFENNKALFNEVPLQHIASMLGMSPETLSRIRKKQIENS